MNRKVSLLIAPLLVLASFTIGCNSNSQRLAQASQVVAHSLNTFEQAEQLAVSSGKISSAQDVTIQGYIKQVAIAGQALDAAIKANESNPAVSVQLNNFLSALNGLIQQGIGGISDKATQQALSVAIQGAETAIALIAATIGSSATTSTVPAAPVTPTTSLNYQPDYQPVVNPVMEVPSGS